MAPFFIQFVEMDARINTIRIFPISNINYFLGVFWGRCKDTTSSSFSLTSNKVTITTNCLSKTDSPVDNWNVCPCQACAMTACSECAR